MRNSSQEESSLRKQLKGHFQFWPCQYLALRFWCLAKNLKMKRKQAVMGVETPVKEVVQKAVEENVSKTVVEHVTVHVKEHAIKGHGNII